MRFLIENFGPVKEANILKKPLTLLIGPNATGKSYITYLLWCLSSTEPDFDSFDRIFEPLSAKDFGQKKLGETAEGFLFKVFEDPRPLHENLEEHIKNTFRVDEVSALIRRGMDRCKFEICSDKRRRKIKFEIDEHGLNYVSEGLTKPIKENLKIEAKSLHRRTFLEMLWNGKLIRTTRVGRTPRSSILDLVPSASRMLFDGYFSYADTFVAPDARAGLMRAREPIIHEVFTAQGPVSMNAPDRAFMGIIEALDISVRNKQLGELADFIEELLSVKFGLRRAPPRYMVKIEDLEIPLQQAPSGYRELAPLVLVLRHEEMSDMFIEEPEAHLHPDAQIAITRGLAGAAKRGPYIVMTTHSIYVLDEISNLLRLNKLGEQEKKELGYRSWEGLAPKDVAIYFFSVDGAVEPIEVSKDGLSESGLDRIILEMANKHAAVERLFRKRKT